MLIRAPCDLQKKAFRINSGAIIFKSKHVGRHFSFQGVLERSQRFCGDLHQIKTFGGAVAPPPPTPVYLSITNRTGCDKCVIALRF